MEKLSECIQLKPIDNRSFVACPHKNLSGKLCTYCKIPDQKYKLTIIEKALPRLELIDATKEEHAFLKQLVLNNLTASEEYRISRNAGAFFQGGIDYNQSNKWVLIEFWGSNIDKIFDFIKYVNDHIDNYIKGK